MLLQGKTVLVFGGSGGIGSVIAHESYLAGATVVLLGRREEALREVVTKWGQYDANRVRIMPADASSPEQVERVFKQVVGNVDIVVSAVGTWRRLTIDDSVVDLAQLAQQHFEAIFLPAALIIQAAQQHMRSQARGGLIAHISSHAATKPELGGNLTYGPNKAAATMFAKSVELALRTLSPRSQGVRLVDIRPGIVNTPDNAKLLDTEDKRRRAIQPVAIAQRVMYCWDNTGAPFDQPMETDLILD